MYHEINISAAASKCLFGFLVSKPMLPFPKHPEKRRIFFGHKFIYNENECVTKGNIES